MADDHERPISTGYDDMTNDDLIDVLFDVVAKLRDGTLTRTDAGVVRGEVGRALGRRERALGDLHLTAREAEVLDRMTHPAASTTSVARDIGISEQALRAHLGRAYRKLEVEMLGRLYRAIGTDRDEPPAAGHS